MGGFFLLCDLNSYTPLWMFDSRFRQPLQGVTSPPEGSSGYFVVWVSKLLELFPGIGRLDRSQCHHRLSPFNQPFHPATFESVFHQMSACGLPWLKVSRRMTSRNIIEVLRGLFLAHGVPEHIRSDNGPQLIAKALQKWLRRSSVGPLYIEPGSPWENGYAESFHSKVRDEFLGCEVFESLRAATAWGTSWRRQYNEVRPHS